MKNRHPLAACLCACVGMLAYTMNEDSSNRIHQGEGFRLSPKAMSAAEWTVIPGVGKRTAEAMYTASAAGAFDSLGSEGIECAMLRIDGVGPETVRSTEDVMNFGAFEAKPRKLSE